MDYRTKVIKKHLNAVAKQVVVPPTRMRFDEPNLPLETLENYNSTPPQPSQWQFDVQKFVWEFYNGGYAVRAYLIRWLIKIGIPKQLAERLVVHLTLTLDLVWELGYWIVYPDTTNLPEEIWSVFVMELISMINPGPPNNIDDAIWSLFNYFKDKGVFFLGDVFSAHKRGWTFAQIIAWLKFLMENNSGYEYYWPDTPQEAQETIDLYRDLEPGK
jgi:hypothetical protein